jgi:hypothetical protein
VSIVFTWIIDYPIPSPSPIPQPFP